MKLQAYRIVLRSHSQMQKAEMGLHCDAVRVSDLP